ncbi:disease resistance protein RPM1-like [Phragmites australis]|uniref:disease resistance protein RPM1-like n=1 Tax=Phragmites australis TaxID=29695 RepID=UPI002D797107|nr:disease resistance protein RPM1-like [Phragmites australis]
MEDVAVKGLVSGLAKPTLDSVAYWIQLLRGKHTATEEMKREAALLEAALWDTYSCRSSSHLLRKARDQADDLQTEIEAILEHAKRLSRRLYSEANLNTPKAIDQMDDDMLGSVIRRFLEKESRRYVIVLDHISTRAQLKDVLDLAIPDKICENFGRIIVTSRNLDVVGACNNAYRVEVEQLSAPEVWKLFCKKAFSAADFRPELEVGNLRERITGLCDGLPLAIDLLGGLLSKKLQSEWSSIIDELQEHGYTEILERSINDLSDMSQTNINKCLMYFSIFPKGSTVSHNTLVRLWIAEGFIHVQGRKTQEEIATEYLNTLIERHIVQVAEHYQYGRPKSYKLNGLMHDEIRKKAEEENFCTTLVESLSNSLKRIRRLSVQVTVKEFPKTVYLLNVISLFVSSRTSHIAKLLSSTRSLKILSLTDESIQVFPKEISKLTHLRYLNLGNTKISKLPASVGNLINLQTLILKGTLVSQLPKAILRVRQLQHLLAYRYDVEKKPDRQPDIIYGVKVPKGIGDLKELKTLSIIEANKDSSTVKELHKLTKLKRLGIVKLKGDDGPDLCTAVSEMGQLSSISLTSSDNEPINLRNLLTIPPKLERLYLRGRLNVNADFFPSLQALVRLRLVGSSLADSSFNELQKLPKLAELALIQALDAEKLNFLQNGFPNLKILDLEQLNSLVEIEVHGSLRNLSKLILRNCSRLTSVPLGIEHLKELKEFHLFDMPESFLQKLQKGNENYESIRRIKVICYYKEGFPQVKTEPQDAGSTSYCTAEEDDDHGISDSDEFSTS